MLQTAFLSDRIANSTQLPDNTESAILNAVNSETNYCSGEGAGWVVLSPGFARQYVRMVQ